MGRKFPTYYFCSYFGRFVVRKTRIITNHRDRCKLHLSIQGNDLRILHLKLAGKIQKIYLEAYSLCLDDGAKHKISCKALAHNEIRYAQSVQSYRFTTTASSHLKTVGYNGIYFPYFGSSIHSCLVSKITF